MDRGSVWGYLIRYNRSWSCCFVGEKLVYMPAVISFGCLLDSSLIFLKDL